MFTATRLQKILSIAALCGLSACQSLMSPQSDNKRPALPPPSNTFAKAGVAPEALLNRITWGSTFSTKQQVQAVGLDRYLDQQLRGQTSVVPPTIQNQINALTISQNSFESLVRQMEAKRIVSEQQKGTDDTLRKEYQQEMNRLAKEAASRSLLRQIYASNQLHEQMSWFWMNHFNMHNSKHNLRVMIGDFEEHAIRPYALGNFRDLLRATVFHPAMLRYLDNEYNAANRINENYARELMELHTMGVNGGYSQRDVQELARVLTGVGVNLSNDAPKMKHEISHLYIRRGLFEFNPQRHDFGDKQLLGSTIKGKGLKEVDEVLDLLVRQPATAHFISQKLANFFVSDQPSEALVNAMVQSFLNSDGDIAFTLRTLFDSPEFIASLGKKFKDPLHYVVSYVRLAYDGSTITNTSPLLNWLNTMGQPFNGRQTPDGYQMTASAWASPGQMSTRFEIARLLANGSPNLFKAEKTEASAAAGAPASIPSSNLANSAYMKNWVKSASPRTQEALAKAGSPTEWNLFFLSSPEMMHR